MEFNKKNLLNKQNVKILNITAIDSAFLLLFYWLSILFWVSKANSRLFLLSYIFKEFLLHSNDIQEKLTVTPYVSVLLNCFYAFTCIRMQQTVTLLHFSLKLIQSRIVNESHLMAFQNRNKKNMSFSVFTKTKINQKEQRTWRWTTDECDNVSINVLRRWWWIMSAWYSDIYRIKIALSHWLIFVSVYFRFFVPINLHFDLWNR